MKKTVKSILTIVMLLAIVCSLTACGGGVDKQPATDALNKVSLLYNDVANYMNENIESFDEEATTFMTDLYNKIEEHTATIQSEDATQEQLDEIVTWCGPIEERLNLIKTTYNIG